MMLNLLIAGLDTVIAKDAALEGEHRHNGCPRYFSPSERFPLKKERRFFYFRSTDSKLIFLSFSLVLRLQLKTSVSYLRSVTESVKRIVPRLSSSYLQQTTFNLHFSFYLTPILLSLPPLSHPIPVLVRQNLFFFYLCYLIFFKIYALCSLNSLITP